MVTRIRTGLLALLVLAVLAPALPLEQAQAQQQPPRRVTRTYIPAEELVNFAPSTSFNDFIAVLNPIFRRSLRKEIIDPDERTFSIGVPISNMHFLDALDLVLATHGLTYRETSTFFLIEAAVVNEGPPVVPSPGSQANAVVAALANAQTREIQIDAMVFQVNLTEARQLGIDWNVFFGGTSGGQSGGSGTGTGGSTGGTGGTQGETRFLINTDAIADIIGNNVILPSTIDIGTLTRFFRLLESEGAGETLSQPSIVVQSGKTGTLQDGEDFPIQTRDFAGNTNTEFVQTGVIITVLPTFLSDSTYFDDGRVLDFVHLNAKVERSTGRPFGESVSVARNQVNTDVLMLDGEMVIIGGLYSKEVTTFRRGIPLLKDIPLLKYLFSYQSSQEARKELIIVLRASLRDPLYVRQGRPVEDDIMERARREFGQRLDLMGVDKVQDTPPQRTPRRNN